MAKSEDRFLVRASQDVTLDGEIWGAEVRASDGSVKTYGIAGADGQAEAARKEAETAREAAETKRAEDEAARTQAETARAASEKERAAQQVKNNADQAANNAAAQGLIAVIVDNYDPETLKPNGEGQNGKMYLVPMPEANAIPVSFALTPTGDGEYTARQVDARSAAAGDVYVEWLWINNQYERIGLSTATLDPITTDHIDAVASGDSPQGKQVLTLTGLTYLWAKLKTAFSAIGHKHPTSDVTGLDTALGDKATKAELKTVQDSLSLCVPYVTGVKDLDSIPNTFCFFMTDASPAGSPAESGEWFVGLQFRLNDRWMTQALFPIGSTSIYMRAINNGNKYNWIKLGAH